MDDSRLASLPATRHQHSYGLNFADGHAEFFKLRPEGVGVTANSPDLQRLKQATTVK
jgi:hypothetical protein